jgi:hypothetical protein
MIHDRLGVLSKAQAITDADEISENVVKGTAADFAAMTDVWWVVDTAVAAATAGTLKFALVLATAAGLGTSIEICSVLVAAITEARVATAGKRIIAINVGKTIKDIIGSSGDTYYFLGMKNTLSASTTISINAALSNSEPRSGDATQVVDSNVGIPAKASAGS